MKSLSSRLPVGRLGLGTILSTIGLTARAVLQAGYLILLSRWMGADGYGLFSGSVAAAALLAPLSGWGVYFLVSERISRGAPAPLMWGGSLVLLVLSSAVLSGVVLLACHFLLDARLDAGTMLMVAVAELLALPVAQVATSLFQATGHFRDAAALPCLVPACRVLAVGAGLLAGLDGGAMMVASLHFAGSLVGGALAVAWVIARNGRPAWPDVASLLGITREGTHYAFGALMTLSYREIDKVLLLQIAGAAVAGTYTAAARVVGILVLPVMALTANAMPRLFAAADPAQRARTLGAVTRAAAGYGVLAMGLAAVAAPLMPHVFGADFADASHYVLLLAPWVPLFALHQVVVVGLTTSGRQPARVWIEGGGMALLAALNLALLPRLGGVAAVFALVAAELFMITAGWLVLRRAR
jgi:O-antigen/teichoic acid export membrane protein